MVPELSKRYTTYAVDLIGFGQSPTVNGFGYTMAAQGEAVMDFIKGEGLSNAILIGHSMGGGVCLHLAKQATRDGAPGFKKMVLIAPVAYPPKSTPELFAVATLCLLDTFLKVDPPRHVVETLVRKILVRTYNDDSRITSKQIEGYIDGLSKASQLKAFIRHIETIGQVAVPASEISTIKIDTSIIWGQKDNLVSDMDMNKLRISLANSTLKNIPNCGHIPHEELPEETNKLVMDSLDGRP